ncbi:MAG: hypothetical protein E7488_03840 [Ruminococcaceae bacterium]|nr:hypothetical protein [Oscillospiraceae bacterium]
MKRLSILVALMLCVTIGGVYAAWTYAGTNDIADAYAEAKVTITDAELTGANGTYKVESNLVLTIDQANEDHEAELVFSSNNSEAIFLKVTFIPADNAPQAIKNDAVESELYFGTTTLMQYKMDADGNYSADGTPTDIFTFVNGGNGELDNIFTWTPQQDGSFTYTLDETALKDQISLSQTFVLDIKTEHDAFREALNGNIVARVTDGTVTN